MLRAILFLLVFAFPAPALAAEPLDNRAVQVIDGDTIRLDGLTYRLVGFDAPETYRAKCSSERERGNRATMRLRQLIATGGASLEAIPCSCAPGTEGTFRCNYGRACGVLTAGGRDVADIMITEGLSRPYVCGARHCPRRAGWCEE